MKCPECLSPVAKNAGGRCLVCGFRPGPSCRECHTLNRSGSQYCAQCGQPLLSSDAPHASTPDAVDPHPPVSTPHPTAPEVSAGSSERKLVTVLFSDLSGYSTLCEQIDPEDVREMMNLIFKEIVGIIVRYDGFIDRIIGDEVLAVFGIPHIHEDDPIRAIHAALDIHSAVTAMSDRFRGRLAKPLSMHSGIATGLIVTGEIDLTSGMHGITGETVNKAALLTNLAAADQILVDSCTMASTSGLFLFHKRTYSAETLAAETIDAYRVLTPARRPDKTRRLRGLRSRLIGRESEMQALREALATVEGGTGCFMFIAGEVGTGKSRLIAEFKNAVADANLTWLQGNAFSYTQGVPYSPVIDLLERFVDVRETDSESEVRRKLIDELGPLEGRPDRAGQVLDRLFTLSSDDRVNIRPEAWKLKLRRALIRMIHNQSRRGLTVIAIEDLHWADPSSIDLFRSLINEADLPVLFLASFRPGQMTLDETKLRNPYYRRQTILLKELPPDQGESMVRSILQSERVPPALSAFIADHLSGNPFFIEETINALIDQGVLRKEETSWTLNGPIGDTVFSSTISTIIAARFDRLGEIPKRIVQEASVIGRRFSPSVLMQVSSYPNRVASSLDALISLGMILASDDPTENAFQFKHTLVQEVAYNSILKQQRRELHEKIGLALEAQHPDRIDAICERLAHHFSNGRSLKKAVTYLVASGHKGLRKYAVSESHDYFKRAYQLLTGKGDDRYDGKGDRQMVELLLSWFLVFHLRGRYEDILTLLERHESLALSSSDAYLRGMYLSYMGWAYQRRECLDQSRDYLLRALTTGEQADNYRVIAYACACLIWTCTDQGRLDEALAFAARAEDASRSFESDDPSWSFAMDQNLVRFVLTGAAIASWFKGECDQCHRLGDRLVAYGKAAGDENSLSEGHLAHAMACFTAGDSDGAIAKCRSAMGVSVDPLFTVNARFLMAYANLAAGEISQTEKELAAVIDFCRSSGYEYIGTSANALSSIVSVARGRLSSGIGAVKAHIAAYQKRGKPYHASSFHYMLGRIYLGMFLKEQRLDLGRLIRNLPFLLVHYPKAASHARHHFTTAIEMAARINARGLRAQALLDLGRLYVVRKRHALAKPLLEESLTLFEQLGATVHLARARETMAQLSAGKAGA